MSRAITRPASTEVSYEDYMAMPISRQRCEVVDGGLAIMPAPGYVHQRIQLRLARHLEDFLDLHDLGVVIIAPADVFIRKRPKLQVRQPDIMVFSNDRAGFRAVDDLDRLQNEEIAPDLAVEVLSPGQTEATLAEKLADYASIRVNEVWLVDPEARTVKVLTRDGDRYAALGLFSGGDTIRSAVLLGLALPVASIFA